MLSITVITPALPTRLSMLAEAAESVKQQTLPPAAHLVAIDYDRLGSATMRNQLVRVAITGWVAFLDDDDVLYPSHLATLAAARNADIVYSRCEVTGRDGWNPFRPFDAAALRLGNYIPATVLMRRQLFLSLGGFRPAAEVQHGWEDWDLWLRALDAGARFAYTDETTWLYRFHAGNKTRLGEAACH